MDFRRRAFFCLAALALIAGCRQNNAHRELLERELRFQEDRIYELEAELETARRELDRYCRTPATSNADSMFSTRDDDVDVRSQASKTLLSPPSANFVAPPDVALPPPTTADKPVAPPFSGPPVILPPDPTVPEGLPPRVVTPGTTSGSPPVETVPAPDTPLPRAVTPGTPPLKPMSSPKFMSPSLKSRSSAGDDSPAFSTSESVPNMNIPALPSNTRVTSISLHQRTGGWNSDGRPGDDGVLVLLEPRNPRGEIVAGGGDISVVLIDPAVPGEGGRYARWDFSADDAAALFRPAASETPASIYLELPWPEAAPQHPRLRLFVRMRTADGRQLQTDREIVVALDPAAAASTQATPFIHQPASPEVTPASAPAETNSPAEIVPALNWGRPRTAPPVLSRPEPALLPSTTEPASEPVFEADGSSGPALGPALIPATR